MLEKLKRTELWMALLAAILPILNQELFDGKVPADQILAGIGAIGLYIGSRWHSKIKNKIK